MKFFIKIFLVFTLFCSCISLHTTERIDTYSVKSDIRTGLEYFIFKSNISPLQTKLSLRRQFDLSKDQKLSDFKSKLFKDLDVLFSVSVGFYSDRNRSLDLTPLIINKDDAEVVEGGLETYVRIEVIHPNGENCLSSRSLFTVKMRSFLEDIKNNIKEQDYSNVSSK